MKYVSTAWVVDEDVTYQQYLSSFLSTQGFEVKSFCSGDECINQAYEQPDVIIMDNNVVNDYRGVDIIRKLKEEQPNTPVVLIAPEEKLISFEALTSFENIFNDCSECPDFSKLKLTLERIDKVRALRSKQRKKGLMVAWSIAIATAIIMFSILFHALNV